jgi:transcriptional regulator with XRE-family HTH domain
MADQLNAKQRPAAVGFAMRLTSLMRSRGMSQTKLAETIGSTQSVVSRLCNAYAVPRVDTVAKMRDALGCSWDELLGDDPREWMPDGAQE